MLKYHLLLPSQQKQHIAVFQHYLTLGSHLSPYELDLLLAFSVITLNPKERLPEIQNNSEEKFSTVVVPLKGKIKIDGQSLQAEHYDKQNLFWNAKTVGTVDGDEKSTTFAYIAVQGADIKNIKIELIRYDEETEVELDKEFILVVEGQITFKEEANEPLIIKNKYNFQEATPLFYAAEPIKIAVDKGSLILRVADKL